MLVEERWHHGYVWHVHTHNHTPRQLWFPQVAYLSLQREDLSEALFNKDVKMSAVPCSWRGANLILTEMFHPVLLWLTSRQAPSLTQHTDRAPPEWSSGNTTQFKQLFTFKRFCGVKKGFAFESTTIFGVCVCEKDGYTCWAIPAKLANERMNILQSNSLVKTRISQSYWMNLL